MKKYTSLLTIICVASLYGAEESSNPKPIQLTTEQHNEVIMTISAIEAYIMGTFEKSKRSTNNIAFPDYRDPQIKYDAPLTKLRTTLDEIEDLMQSQVGFLSNVSLKNKRSQKKVSQTLPLQKEMAKLPKEGKIKALTCATLMDKFQVQQLRLYDFKKALDIPKTSDQKNQILQNRHKLELAMQANNVEEFLLTYKAPLHTTTPLSLNQSMEKIITDILDEKPNIFLDNTSRITDWSSFMMNMGYKI